MLEQLKEIKEKLSQLIQEVERLENAVHGEEIIIERKDFDKLKRIGDRGVMQIFQFFDGPVFELNGQEGSQSDHYRYEFSIFKALLEGKLDRIILLKRNNEIKTKEGYTITHDIEKEVDTKLRDAYRKIQEKT
jgi:hypothetical protein